MIEERFIIEQKDYELFCSVNFAECHTKQKYQPNNNISATLDFYSAPQKVVETFAKSMLNPTESKQERNAKPTLSPQERSDIATEYECAVDIPVSAENSEKPQESAQNKPNISNFANAHIF